MRIRIDISDLEYHEYRFYVENDTIRFQSRTVWKRATKRHDHRLDKNVSWSSYSHDKYSGVKPELTYDIKQRVLNAFRWD